MTQKAKKTQSPSFKRTLNSKKSLDPLIYLQVIEPTEKDQGTYSIVIVDPENSHKRTLDLSGEGAVLSVSYQPSHTVSETTVGKIHLAHLFKYQTLIPAGLDSGCEKLAKFYWKKKHLRSTSVAVGSTGWMFSCRKCVSVSQRTPQKHSWAFLPLY